MATKNVIKKIIKDWVEYFIYSTKWEVEVDSALSDTSENPVQNKVVKWAIDWKITNPSGWTTGQVLTKTANWESWQDAQGWLPEWWTVWQVLKKTANWAEWWTVSWWHNYNWETKTISNSSLEIWLRTIVDNPWSNFTLTVPATLEDWMEYVLRCVNTESYTITLWIGFTNPFGVDLSLSYYATDQFVFVAVWWNLELQPLFNN